MRLFSAKLSRRNCFGALASLFPVSVFAGNRAARAGAAERPEDIPEGQELFGVFDIPHEVYHPVSVVRAWGGKCLLDGVELSHVTYANTEAGVVWTLDIMRDRSGPVLARTFYRRLKLYPMGIDLERDFPGRHVMIDSGLLRERLSGRVQLFAGSLEAYRQMSWKKRLPTGILRDDNSFVVADVTNQNTSAEIAGVV